MAKKATTRKVSKSAVADLSTTTLLKVEDELKKLRVEYTRKTSSIIVPSVGITLYFDSIAKKVIGLKGDKEVYAQADVKKVSTLFSKDVKPTSSVEKTKEKTIKDKKVKKSVLEVRAEKAAIAEAKKQVKKEAKPKQEPKEKYVELVEESPVLKTIIKKSCEPVELVSIKDMSNQKIEGYMGVMNLEQKKVVSIVSDTYNLLPNKVIVDPVLQWLEQNKIKYTMDKFTYVTDQRMRLHLTFPEFKIKDDSKDGILASVFLHNSYNQIESYRLVAGGMRQVCSNGMIIGTVIKKLSVIHQATNIKEISIANIESVLGGFASNTKHVEARIIEMIQQKAVVKDILSITKNLEPRITAYLLEKLGLCEMGMATSQAVAVLDDLNEKQTLKQSMYDVYNILTYYVSHLMQQRYRTDFLMKFSKKFEI